MTLVLGLRSRGGLVLAADSQRTEGVLREQFPKLFTTPAGIAWGTAGGIAIQQELYELMATLRVPDRPGRRETREAIVAAVAMARARAGEALDELSAAAGSIEGLFGWYSKEDDRTFLLRVPSGGPAEFAPRYTAIGAPSTLARFALSRSEYLEYDTLPLAAAKMVAYNVADDVIRVSTSNVGGPVQLAAVTKSATKLANSIELRGIADTVAAFREHQRDYIVREDGADSDADTGVRP
jgi:20S proteasome alpha/beta subunit